MAGIGPRLENRAEVRARTAARRLSRLLELPEPAYRRLLRRIETDPLFLRLAQPRPDRPRALSRRPLRGARLHWRPFEEGASTDGAGELFRSHAAAVEQIRKMGCDAYQRLFLSDAPPALEEAARRAGLSLRQARGVRAFTDAFLLSAETRPAARRSLGGPHPVAAIEREGRRLWIGYVHPSDARGTFQFDRDEFARRKSELSPEERRRLPSLLRWIDAVNRRRSTLHRLLEESLRLQKAFFLSGREEDLAPWTQKEAAARIEVSPSTVCRAAAGRSVRTPEGRDRRLADLFPGPRAGLSAKIRNIVESRPELTDREVREALASRHGIFVSRRSVNRYRRELKK